MHNQPAPNSRCILLAGLRPGLLACLHACLLARLLACYESSSSSSTLLLAWSFVYNNQPPRDKTLLLSRPKHTRRRRLRLHLPARHHNQPNTGTRTPRLAPRHVTHARACMPGLALTPRLPLRRGCCCCCCCYSYKPPPTTTHTILAPALYRIGGALASRLVLPHPSPPPSPLSAETLAPL